MGRPPVEKEPLTSAEKQKRYRQRKRGLLPPVEKAVRPKTVLARLREENSLLRSENYELREQVKNLQHLVNQKRHTDK